MTCSSQQLEQAFKISYLNNVYPSWTSLPFSTVSQDTLWTSLLHSPKFVLHKAKVAILLSLLLSYPLTVTWGASVALLRSVSVSWNSTFPWLVLSSASPFCSMFDHAQKGMRSSLVSRLMSLPLIPNIQVQYPSEWCLWVIGLISWDRPDAILVFVP